MIIFVQDGDTALHIACKKGHINVTESLLFHEADMAITNNEGNTPLDVYQGTSKDEIVSLFSMYNPKRGELLKKQLYSTPTCLIFII